MNAKVTALLLGLAACNYDAGECYVRGQGGEGVGSGVITPGGAGGYGDTPPEPEPQGAPSPVDPCLSTAECTVTWKADSEVCKDKGTAGTCTTLYQGQHATLEKAKEQCEFAHGAGKSSGVVSCGPCKWVTSAASDCGDKYQDCINNGPSSCLKEEAGKTLCNRCLERCNAGDSPSAKCRKCKF